MSEIKCIRCKSERPDEKFINNKGRKLKTCLSCRNRVKEQRQEYRDFKTTKSWVLQCINSGQKKTWTDEDFKQFKAKMKK